MGVSEAASYEELEGPSLQTAPFPGGVGAQAAAGPAGRWVPRDVIAGCGTALHRIGGPTLGSLGVTSCLRGEGRSTVSVATALVQRYSYGRSVILVELDLEQPSLAARLDLSEGPGVAEVLRGEASLQEAVQWPDERFGVLTGGRPGGAAAALLAEVAGADFLRQLGAHRDVVVADLPPLPPEGLGLQVAAQCESVMLIVRAGTTPMTHIRRAIETMDKAPWVILNGTGSKTPRWLRRLMGRSQ